VPNAEAAWESSLRQRRPVLAYFDQTHIGNFTGDQVDRLTELVDKGWLFAPFSGVHLVETLKQAQIVRGETLRRLRRLSSGLGLPTEAELPLREWQAFVGSGEPIEEALRCRSTWPGQGFAGVGEHLELFESVPDEVIDQVRGPIAVELEKAAENHLETRHTPLASVLEGLAKVVEAASAGSVPAACVLETIPATDVAVATVFRTLGVRRSIYRKSGAMEANDVMDLGFLCPVLPYFDVVGVDRKMNRTLRRARTAEAEEIRPILYRAKVLYRPDDLVREIEKRVSDTQRLCEPSATP